MIVEEGIIWQKNKHFHSLNTEIRVGLNCKWDLRQEEAAEPLEQFCENQLW